MSDLQQLTALDAYQARKGRMPLQVPDRILFEQIFNEYKHMHYKLFKSFLLSMKSASLQVRTEFGKSEVLVKGFQSILRKHVDFWQLPADRFNFDLLIDVIDVLGQLKIPAELLLKYDLGKATKNALAKASKGVDPTYPLLGHAKKTYNQMKANWGRYIEEERQEGSSKRKASDSESASKRPKVVAGPWSIKASDSKDSDLKDEEPEDDEDDILMPAREPLGNFKSYPKGILRAIPDDEDGDVKMEEPKKKKKSVGFNMNKNAIKRIDQVNRHGKAGLYSERGEASRALKQKQRIDWRTPRELELDFTMYEMGMESEEARNQTNRERSTNFAQYSSTYSVPECPKSTPDPMLTSLPDYKNLKFIKWSKSEERPETLQYYATYVFLPQLHQDRDVNELLQLEKLKASLNPTLQCPFDNCKAGKQYCTFKHDTEAQ